MNPTYENYLGVFAGLGVLSITGRVGLCQDGVYGSVCDADWDQEDANVICKSSYTFELGKLQTHVFIDSCPGLAAFIIIQFMIYDYCITCHPLGSCPTKDLASYH